MQHNYQEENSVAATLARMGRSSSSDVVYLGTPPKEVSLALLYDVWGCRSTRLVHDMPADMTGD